MASGDNGSSAKHDALEMRLGVMERDFAEQKRDTTGLLREILSELKDLRIRYAEERGEMRERIALTEREAAAANKRLNGFAREKTRDEDKTDKSLADMQKELNTVIYRTAAVTGGTSVTLMSILIGILIATGVIGG